MSLTDFPLDVLLELTKEFDLPDALNLAATCTLCATVLLSPYLWIASLRRIEQVHNRPLPCAFGTDIVGLPLDALRKIAVHAYKLLKNWHSDAPRVASFRTIELDDSELYDGEVGDGGKIWHIIPIYSQHLWHI
ncbi:hypothetical protein FB45DRAFT_1066325 [Roridomyces roridus]|uniref:F-box domain-containing protein n=1 Tax=Roridomyces roridus TaxID=1738132 RepID=A0AAD7B4U9_9AGAR|nr:hypothetical protein FB45DRAFT_1066325 [Roridomyces roridus]